MTSRATKSAVPPAQLTVNGLSQPLGVGADGLAFGWMLEGATSQIAARVQLVRSTTWLDNPDWDSGWLATTQPFQFQYAGPPLEPRSRYVWRVSVRRDDGTESSWAESHFETGLFSADEWTGTWITAPKEDRDGHSTLYFRTEIDLPTAVVEARAFVTALGWYRLLVNQTDVTGHALVPRWTPFDHEVEYQTYDATDAFIKGVNVIGVIVADGRFRGSLGMSRKGGVYGDDLAVLAQIELSLKNGQKVVINSSDSWDVGRGRIRTSDPKHGERADLRIDDALWRTPGHSLEQSRKAISLPSHPRAVVAEEVERVQAVAEMRAKVSRTPSGVQLIDFGQNFAGVVRLQVPAARVPRVVRIAYSEVLTPEGELDTSYLKLGRGGGTARWFQRDEVTLGEAGDYTPSFTIHGFRYATVEGLDTELAEDDVVGIVLSSNLKTISTFRASDHRLEKLWRNVLWGLRSNFVDTPTDCPTRERSGWTGDIQVFGPTASQMVAADNYLRRYLSNVAIEQYADGRVPPIIPTEDSRGRNRNPIRFASTSVGWGDVTVMLPWTLYEYYGDIDVLRRQYESAKRWVDQLARRAQKTSLRRHLQGTAGGLEPYVVDTGYHWGEWLRPGEGFDEVLGNVVSHRPVVATAYFAHSSRLLAQIARVIGEAKDAEYYDAQATNAALAWRQVFVREDGARIGDDKQDDYVRALSFELLALPQRRAAATRLVELIRAADYHIGTGFLSTPMLLQVLVDSGNPEVAYRLLFQETTPSWLHQVDQGATTIWENWEGYDKRGSAKGSHNHYAFGSVAAFLQEHIGGIRPLGAGYVSFAVEPAVDSGLAWASVEVLTPYGKAGSSWRRQNSTVHLDVDVPTGATAEVRVWGHRRTLGAGQHTLTIELQKDN